ncbi:MAG: hypothetical protein ABL984_05410 [Pyrinomonadaceae bacterium]
MKNCTGCIEKQQRIEELEKRVKEEHRMAMNLSRSWEEVQKAMPIPRPAGQPMKHGVFVREEAGNLN